MNPLKTLNSLGQSLWYDNIHRAMIASGELAAMIEEDGLRGITSNPTIFEKAIAGNADYDAAIRNYLRHHPQADARELFFALAIEDIQAAADLLLPVYQTEQGHDGLVSLEVSPDLAHDTDGTITEAHRLWERVARPNLMIKVPATAAGIPAVEELIAAGINVNATLLFGVERYQQIADAYLSGLESRLRRGQPIDRVASVASFFVSRVDAAVEKALVPHPIEADALRGKIAIANAKIAYAAYHELFGGQRFAELAQEGAKPQRLLWASTGTKSAGLSDVLYIEALIGPHTVTTVPPATYNAYRDHGKPHSTLDQGLDEAKAQLQTLTRLGINLKQLTQKLEEEGVVSFANSFTTLLTAIKSKAGQLTE